MTNQELSDIIIETADKVQKIRSMGIEERTKGYTKDDVHNFKLFLERQQEESYFQTFRDNIEKDDFIEIMASTLILYSFASGRKKVNFFNPKNNYISEELLISNQKEIDFIKPKYANNDAVLSYIENKIRTIKGKYKIKKTEEEEIEKTKEEIENKKIPTYGNLLTRVLHDSEVEEKLGICTYAKIPRSERKKVIKRKTRSSGPAEIRGSIKPEIYQDIIKKI